MTQSAKETAATLGMVAKNVVLEGPPPSKNQQNQEKKEIHSKPSPGPGMLASAAASAHLDSSVAQWLSGLRSCSAAWFNWKSQGHASPLFLLGIRGIPGKTRIGQKLDTKGMPIRCLLGGFEGSKNKTKYRTTRFPFSPWSISFCCPENSSA